MHENNWRTGYKNNVPHETKVIKKTKKSLAWRTKKKLAIIYLKKFLGFLLSTLGLFILLTSYTIFGGFLFHRIESSKEVQTQLDVKTSRAYHVDKLWNTTKSMNILFRQNWSNVASKILRNYTMFVFNITKCDGWNGQDRNESAELQWSFTGSMLYSVTVITTIGYGHIAPKTDEGRVVTIFYALVGIPLCIFSVTHIGGFMATIFRFLYKNIFCGLCCVCFNKMKRQKSFSREPSKKDVPIYVSLLLIAGYIGLGALLFGLWENDWNVLIGSYFCFITLSTIGFGDFVPGASLDPSSSQEKLVLCTLYLIVGLALLAMCFDLMQEEARCLLKTFGKKIGLINSEKI
ncbi:hypothetical protein HELRODRAFT_89246 [Helobdella robusta]|uniref:Potassium channel domain-containing protein n=1 Tax=Helobdella robusta TaxID=6412 RepID=T1G7A9_HELRO|nr:hypothetical protein HELRODRAFT_89246 [Helobdella robusta]ESN93130.1 hypothetical protein HELRODRAFT_89246 [Helobdella robusta]